MSTAFCTTTSSGLRSAVLCAAVLPLLFWQQSVAAAQAPVATSAAGRLAAVTSTTSLKAFPKPWHLKLAVTIPDLQGKETEGSIETWHAGAESRTVAVFNGGTTTAYEHSDERYQNQEGPPVPQLVYDALDAVLHPGPEQSLLAGAKPELRSQSFGKATLDCVMLSRPMTPPPPPRAGQLPVPVPLGLFPTWCMLPKSDHLQLSYSFGNPTVVVTALGKFGDREIVIGIDFVAGTSTLARTKTVSLSTFVPAEGEFVPPPGMKPVGAHIPGVQGGVVSGRKIGGTPPEYPVSARMAHIGGSVVLHAIIGSDGHIQHLTVTSTPDPDLAISALRAVRTWTYKPYLLNGEPTSIDTTITVNYNIYPG